MKDINKFLFIVLIAILNIGCSDGLSAKDYMQYFEKNRNKFCKIIERNGVSATISYMPNEYYAAREIVFDSSRKSVEILKRYENSIFFMLSLKSTDSSSQSVLLSKNGMQGFKENVMQNTFNRAEDVFLLDGNDTVKTASCSYERNWGFGNDDVFLIGFSRKDIKKRFKNYNLIVRNILPELGTIEIRTSEIVVQGKKLRG